VTVTRADLLEALSNLSDAGRVVPCWSDPLAGWISEDAREIRAAKRLCASCPATQPKQDQPSEGHEMTDTTTAPTDHSGCATKHELSLVIEAMHELVHELTSTLTTAFSAAAPVVDATDAKGI